VLPGERARDEEVHVDDQEGRLHLGRNREAVSNEYTAVFRHVRLNRGDAHGCVAVQGRDHEHLGEVGGSPDPMSRLSDL
jgi:hypothetical protein